MIPSRTPPPYHALLVAALREGAFIMIKYANVQFVCVCQCLEVETLFLVTWLAGLRLIEFEMHSLIIINLPLVLEYEQK